MKPKDLRAPGQPAPLAPLRTTLLAGLTLALAFASTTTFGGACDSTATFSFPSLKLENIRVVSAAPLVKEGDSGQLRRECSVGPDDQIGGVELGFLMTSNDPGFQCSSGAELDWGVRPGDKVQRRRLVLGENVTVGTFSLDVDCVEPYPDPDNLTSRECQGLSSPDFNLAGADFRPFYEPPANEGDLPVRCRPVAVALLIDQSGSMRGFVDETNANREGRSGFFQIPGDADRVRKASDPNNTRLAAALEFINKLNANDQLVVFTYHESEDASIQVPCTEEPLPDTGALAGEPEHVRKALACFGVNHALMSGEVAKAFGDESGRTPLWEAVQTAYRFLQREDVDAAPIRHIVVIGDGPDTCNLQSLEGAQATGAQQAGQCSDVTYEQVYNEITQGNEAPGGVPVRVHFVQLQSRGYPARDGRMMELACATQGHFQFVNGNDFPRTDQGLPETSQDLALKEALSRVRYSLLGYWTLASQTAAFAPQPGTAGYLEPGTMFGVSGTLTLKAGELIPQDKLQPFDAAGTASWGPWDLRVAFRRMCAEDSDCTTGAVVPCQVYCAVQEGVCLEPPASLPDGTACTAGGVENGECCAGVCQAGACN